MELDPVQGEPLRVGVLIDSLTQPLWVAKVLEEVESSQIAQIVLIIKNESPPTLPSSFLKRVFLRRHYLLYDLYRKIDNLRSTREPDAFKKISLEEKLGQKPSLRVRPIRRNRSDYFSEESLARIREYRLDVALRFGFGILRGEALQMACYGIWSYHHGDNREYRGGPAGFWEVMEGNPVTGSILQILTEELDNGQVIYRSLAPTLDFSVRKNRNNYYWKSSSFVMRKLRDLYQMGPKALDFNPSDEIPQADRPPLYREPKNLQMAWLLLKLLKRYLVYKLLNQLFYEQWTIAFRFQDDRENMSFEIRGFHQAVPPPNRFWADPFPVRRGERNYLFLEEYLEKEKKGRIAVMEVKEGGDWKSPKPVLEKEYHLSYPFVFSWQGQDYMIPETASQKRIELYRCVFFPYKWELEKVLIEGVNAVDATLAEIGGVWWMFVNLALEGALNYDELHLFYADGPFGPWKPHRRNPVISDASRARPAGRLFRHQGTWYRPSQDCTRRYGYSVRINKILKLNPSEFQEVEVSQILPRWQKRILGTHTFNFSEGLTVVDGLLWRSYFPRGLILVK